MSNTDFDPDAYLATAAPTTAPPAAKGFDPDAYLAQQPGGNNLVRAVTDIPGEIHSAAGEALGDINAGFNPESAFQQQSFQAEKNAPLWDISNEVNRLDAMGRGIAAIGGLVAAPVVGAGRSLIGHVLAAATPQGFYGPQVNTPDQVYARAKQDADMAISALGAARGAVPGIAGPVARLPKPPPAPSIAQLYDAANGDYAVAHAMDVNVQPSSIGNFASNLQAQLEGDGLRDYLAPKTFSALQEMQNAAAQAAQAQGPGVVPMTNLADIDGMRRVLGNAAADFGNPTEQHAAGRAIAGLDSYVRSIPQSDVMSGDVGAAQRVLESARGNYAAAKRAELIESQEDKANRQAGVTGSGANINNALRQKMNQVLNNKGMQRGFTQDELDQIRSIAMGTPMGNLARKIGKLAPTGVVSSIPVLGAIAAGEPMTAAVVGGIGHAAKLAGEMSTSRGVDALSEMTRNRSPLALQLRGLQRRPANPQFGPLSAATGLVRPNILQTMPALQSPAAAYGQQNQQDIQGPPGQQKAGGAVKHQGRAAGGKVAKPAVHPYIKGARLAKDGNYYLPDSSRPGKFLKVIRARRRTAA